MKYIIDELDRRNRDVELQRRAADESRERLIVELQREVEEGRRRQVEMLKKMEFMEKMKTSQNTNPQQSAQPVPAQHEAGTSPNSVGPPNGGDIPDPFFAPGGDPWPQDHHRSEQHHQQAHGVHQQGPQTAAPSSGAPRASHERSGNGGGKRTPERSAESEAQAPNPSGGGTPPGRDGGEEKDEPSLKKDIRRKHGGNPGGDGGGGGGDDGGGSDEGSEGSSAGESSEDSDYSDSPEGQKRKKRNERIRPLKDKQLGHPDRYDASASTATYRQWRERFRALISAQDDGISWDKILDHVEQMREKIVCPEELSKLRRRFRLKTKHLKIIQTNLYHMLQQYTKGATNERVITATRTMSLDQYRVLYFEGMQVSEHALFLAKGRVWRVAEVKKAADFAQAVDSWEQDRDFLQRHVSYTMPISDQQYALLNICPADLRREVLREYNLMKFPSYLSLKQFIQNLITRDRDIQAQGAHRGVHELERPKGQRKQEQQQQQQQQEAWWGEDDWGQEQGWEQQEQQQQEGTWVDEQGYAHVGALKGKGKGKSGKGKGWGKNNKGKGKGKGKNGKGKGGKGGCAIYGAEDHWKNECPENPLNQGKGGGKAAGAFAGAPAAGKGAFPWVQRSSGPPRIAALGDNPSQWRIGADGQANVCISSTGNGSFVTENLTTQAALHV